MPDSDALRSARISLESYVHQLAPHMTLTQDQAADLGRYVDALIEAALAAAPPAPLCGCRKDSSSPGNCPYCGHREHGMSGCRVEMAAPPAPRCGCRYAAATEPAAEGGRG